MVCVDKCLNVKGSVSVGGGGVDVIRCSVEGRICCIRKDRKTNRYYMRNIKLKLRAHVSAGVTRVHPIGCTIVRIWNCGVVYVGVCSGVGGKIPCHGCVGQGTHGQSD